MFAHIAMSTGWSLRQVRDLSLFDLRDLQAYWADHPPVHVMVAAYLGIKPVTKDKATPAKLRELAGAFGLAVKEG